MATLLPLGTKRTRSGETVRVYVSDGGAKVYVPMVASWRAHSRSRHALRPSASVPRLSRRES